LGSTARTARCEQVAVDGQSPSFTIVFLNGFEPPAEFVIEKVVVRKSQVPDAVDVYKHSSVFLTALNASAPPTTATTAVAANNNLILFIN
jgi:hypothetical protein